MKYILFFFLTTGVFHGQVLHHQMLSSQGSSSHSSKGFMVTQTIGQGTVSGNFENSKAFVGQGFQQSKNFKKKSASVAIITTITYPIPFIETVNFTFSEAIEGRIKVKIFNVQGKLVYNQEKVAIQNSLIIENLYFPAGEYFVKLSAKNYNYSTKILKIK